MFSSRSTHESNTCIQNSSEFVFLVVFVPRQASELVEDVSIRLYGVQAHEDPVVTYYVTDSVDSLAAAK